MTSQTMSDPADPISRTSGPTNLLVLPGDGIGPDIVAATVEVLSAADRRFRRWKRAPEGKFSGKTCRRPVSWIARESGQAREATSE